MRRIAGVSPGTRHFLVAALSAVLLASGLLAGLSTPSPVYAVVTCTAYDAYGGWPASNLCDGNDSTGWASNSGAVPEWVKIDLGAAEYVTAWRIVQTDAYYATSYDVEYSTDNSTWYLRDTGRGYSSGTETFAITGTTARYWRFTATAEHSSGWHVFELTATTGTAPTAPPTAAPTAPPAPQPTASAWPAATPTPLPTEAPYPGTTVDAKCARGLRADTPGDGSAYECKWSADNNYDTGGAHTIGPLCSADWDISGLCITNYDGWWVGRTTGVNTILAVQTHGVPVNTSTTAGSNKTTAVQMSAQFKCDDTSNTFFKTCDPISGNGKYALVVQWLNNAGGIISQAQNLYGPDPGVYVWTTPKYIPPTGATVARAVVICISGEACAPAIQGGGGVAVNGIMWLHMRFWTSTIPSGALDGGSDCLAYQAGGCPTIPGLIKDPNTGGAICGPVSGRCFGPPFIAPATVGVCTQPAVAIDAVGWLSFIACLLTNMPAYIWNSTGVPLINGVIDLFYPTFSLDAMAQSEVDAVKTRVPFSWWNAAQTQLATLTASPAASGEGTFALSATIMGGAVSINPYSISNLWIPYRPWLVAFLYAAFAIWLITRVYEFVSDRAAPKQLVFGLDDPR